MSVLIHLDIKRSVLKEKRFSDYFGHTTMSAGAGKGELAAVVLEMTIGIR
jgi:hypothetical protein